MMKTMRIAAIPGDGIGKEVLPEGIRVLQAAAERWGFALSFEQMEWASCEYYSHHGKMMPDDWRWFIYPQLDRFLLAVVDLIHPWRSNVCHPRFPRS